MAGEDRYPICLVVGALIFSLGCCILYFKLKEDSNVKLNSTLYLVHVIVRHGNRNPALRELYSGNSYVNEEFYPEGYDQINQAGKKTSYNVGKYLRSRYKDFLPELWNYKHLEAISTDFDRTKVSLLLILAGLYPTSTWSSSLQWEPIPYTHVPKEQDKELLSFMICPRYKKLLMERSKLPEIKEYMKKYDKTFSILEKKTNRSMNVLQAFFINNLFDIQTAIGYPLEEWSADVYPEPLHSLVLDMYYSMISTTEMSRINAGFFLKKLLFATEKEINTTLETSRKKIFLYSAHETNVAILLGKLADAYSLTAIPPYGSYVIFELHKINDSFGFKMFYQDYQQHHPKPLKIRGCSQDYFCSFQDFYHLVEELLPDGDEECFN